MELNNTFDWWEHVMEAKPKIFISYARKDWPQALEIYEFLLENNCEPWIDKKKLLPGQNWRKEISKAIRDADFFVACLSPHSIDRTGYVQKELKEGMEMYDLVPEGKITLLPIRLQECEVPERFEDIQWIDWYVEEDKERLLEAIRVTLESKATIIPDAIETKIEETRNNIIIPISNLPQNAKPLELILIPAGTFMMGSPDNEKDRDDGEGPQHKVTISNDFYLGKYPVTQAQWEAVMGNNPSHFKGNPNHPVKCISWHYCQKFIDRLNGMGIGKFRLPTEAEWEYACRGGTTTRFYWGDDLDYKDIEKYAWFSKNSGGTTHEVGLKESNAFGLYDMSGNVFE